MESIDEIARVIDYYEVLGCLHNGEKFKKVINDFERITGVKVDLSKKIPYNISPYEEDESKGLMFLQDYAFVGNFVNIAHKVLKSHDYYMKTFIKDAVKMLGNLDDPNHNSHLIHAYINTPVIQDITFDGKDTFIIYSSEFGTFKFKLANSFYEKYDELYVYMKQKRYTVCYLNAAKVMFQECGCNVIVSLCPSYFVGSYYHAYNYFKDSNLVLDLCSNMFMDKKSYDRLYEPNEIFNMLDKELVEYYKENVESIETSINVDFLKMAAYIQLKNMDSEQKRLILDTNNKFTY